MRIIWDILKNFRLKERVFDQLDATAHVCAPETFLRPIASRQPRPRFSYSHAIRSIPEGTRTVILAFVDDEPALKARLQRERPGTIVLSLMQDIVPNLLASGTKTDLSREPREPRKRYFLLSLPRSGSEFISSLMSINGLGHPVEHLREELATCISISDRPVELLENLCRYGTGASGIFGTKLIAHYLMQASCSAPARTAIIEFLNRFDGGFRIRRPLEECVASYYVALLRNKWHFTTKNANSGTPIPWSQVDLRYVEMLIEFFQDQESFLDQLESHALSPPVASIDYRDFDAERFGASASRSRFVDFFGNDLMAGFAMNSRLVASSTDRAIKSRIKEWVATKLTSRTHRMAD